MSENPIFIDAARRSGADDSVVQALRGIPDREYADPTQVSEAVAG